jgi:EAL domain-containing protein (putative c-di-GMP-specific phosphodiesterase class I)
MRLLSINQPQITFRRISYRLEALLRLAAPEMGMVSPAFFIPLAENNGQINNIGEWFLGIMQTEHALGKSGLLSLMMAVKSILNINLKIRN